MFASFLSIIENSKSKLYCTGSISKNEINGIYIFLACAKFLFDIAFNSCAGSNVQ